MYANPLSSPVPKSPIYYCYYYLYYYFHSYQSSYSITRVLGMTLNCIHIFIVTGCFLYCCVMRPASQRFFKHSYIYLRILIISYLATFLGTNSLSVLMCRKAVNQSINRLQIVFRLHCKPYIHTLLILAIDVKSVDSQTKNQMLKKR